MTNRTTHEAVHNQPTCLNRNPGGGGGGRKGRGEEGVGREEEGGREGGCFALLYFALLCFALLCFVLFCFVRKNECCLPASRKTLPAMTTDQSAPVRSLKRTTFIRALVEGS